ncbi:aldehyde dehydrogenase [Occallatibacter riparius]|uniref:Salicylaldehyde dehydrogenase n=1 Tax=Occallatibacter riparius TaxID=1002689 RepID=A0A9J7BRU3_9BACT|nr:aldehyde dehydrogenase [Occallatibacter riparius]UWZ85579.1 aldehyde dehydrogenase [Occallatibacter riparius]
MNEVALLINGKSTSAKDGRSFDRIDPVKGTPASSAAAAGIADVHAAAEAAAAAFSTWSATGPGQRRELLLKSAEALLAHQSDFIDAMIRETGATAAWAGFNVAFAASILREAASITTQIAGEVIPSDVPGNVAMAIRQPIGVCAAIAPWNAPVILGVRAIATPLACGNTVVFKASEACPAVHRLIGSALHEAGIPDGVLNIITNAPEDAADIVGALIDHPAVRHINFTGSTRVGRVIAERAARHLKPVLLELGGKAPLIVLDDADLDAAVDASIFGAFMNQGQICMSTERIVVDQRIADDFVERLARRAAKLPLQDPSLGPTVLGSMVDAKSAARVATLIEDAVQKGARIAAGGAANGTLMPATVIDGITSSMRIYAEESFGPVVTIVRVSGEDEALRIANDTEYGLSAAIFSRDIARAWNLARQVQTGICHINGPTVHDEPQMPFGGVRASGYGRFGGKRGIDEFTTLRWITMQTAPRHYPF